MTAMVLALLPRLVTVVGFALALNSTAAAGDYSSFRVIETYDLPLSATPSVAAALLSPDGRRILHVGGVEICTLTSSETGWRAAGCTYRTPGKGMGIAPVTDAFWSPANDMLIVPTLLLFYLQLDTDIAVFDPTTMSTHTLTDDNFDGTYRSPGAKIDFAGHWAGDDTLAFIRYTLSTDGAPGALMLIESDGSNERALRDVPATTLALAVSGDGARFSYGVYDLRTGAFSVTSELSIWTFRTGEEPQQVVVLPVYNAAVSLTFSADGTRILVLSQSREQSIEARIVDVATGDVAPVDPDRKVVGASWAPTGSALAYLTYDVTDPEASGLFLAEEPGRPGRALLEGAFMPPVCCGQHPFMWASNDTMLLGQREDHENVLFVRLGP